MVYPFNPNIRLGEQKATNHRIRSRNYLGFCLLIILILTGCGKEEPHRDFKVLFTVNGVERTVYDFESAYVEHLILTGKNDTRAEREVYLTKLIDEILLAESATNKGLTEHPTYQAAVAYQQRKSMIDTYFVDAMEEEIEPLTDDEIRLAFAKRQRKVYVRQLYSKDPSEIEQAHEALKSGEDFVDLANRFYQLPSYDSLAGYLGPMSYFGVEDVVAEAAYSINEGEYSEPVRSSLGYHILYVEYIEFPAMLAEDEYQYRKKGVESQLRLRRQRLVSNEYVYELMSGLNVQTNNDNLLQLRDVISNLDGEGIIEQPTTAESAEALWTDERVERLANSFDRNAVLATYDLDGQTQVFSFGEYLNWLPYLSFQESNVRLGASVGRGMRNQVLFELASQQEYDRDERVKKKVSKRAIEILSELNQYEMTMKAVQDTGTVEVPESFRDRLISSRELLVQADYWKIPANSLQDARRIKREIEQGNKPLEYQGFNMVEYSALDAKENDYDLVRKSLIDTPVIAQSSEQGWMVLQVNRRDISEIATQTKVDDLQRSFKVYNTIQTEVDSLRALANIEIDTELFEEISKLWSPSNR